MWSATTSKRENQQRKPTISSTFRHLTLRKNTRRIKPQCSALHFRLLVTSVEPGS